MTRRPVRALLLSALVHGVLVVLAVSIASRSESPPLFVDLTDTGAVVTAPRQPPSAARPIARAPVPAARAARRSAPLPEAAPAPASAAPRLSESQPDRAPEPAEPSSTARGDELASPAVSGASPAAPAVDLAPAHGGAGRARVGDRAVDADVTGALAARPGQGLARAAPGTGSNPAAADPGTEYGEYLARLRQRVLEALRYPAAARRRGLVGTVHVEVTILPNGAIGAVTVVGSSSHAVLDDAAVATIKSLRPAPFPPDLPARQLRVRLPVVFQLE